MSHLSLTHSLSHQKFLASILGSLVPIYIKTTLLRQHGGTFVGKLVCVRENRKKITLFFSNNESVF